MRSSAAGITAIAAFAGSARAAMTASETANLKLVNDFCAAWPSHDIDKVMAFFSESGTYRVTETQEPNKGREAVSNRIKSFINNVQEFKVLDSWAKGPMVFNERIDSFSDGPLKSWHGVGVFFIKDEKIVEWYDYTIRVER